MAPAIQNATTVGGCLLQRLQECGISHIFGVPGDFNLALFDEIEESKINFVGMCNELNAAYAADGYARIRGIGCVATTYAVGELSAINGVAGAFTEFVPIVNITGCPARKHWDRGTLLHHTLGDYNIPLKIFKHITCDQVVLDDPEQAVMQIDRALQRCLLQKQPIYILVPTDMLSKSDPDTLEECLTELANLCNRSSKPIALPGVLILRYQLQNRLINFLSRTNWPYATMMLAKSILDEENPNYIGLYVGDRSRDYVRKRVEADSDLIVLFGERLTDFNTGGFTANLPPEKTVRIGLESVAIGHHQYENVYLWDLLDGLAERIHRRSARRVMRSSSSSCF